MQTMALLIDAYRELNARRLFWIVLGLSVLVVAIVALLGVNENGLSVAWYTFENSVITSETIPPALFYKTIFVSIAIPWWLTWIAAVLALVSTASVIPDFISQGAIELTLSKPISRVRLYLTKCAGALLFAFLQVLVFAVAAFIVIGLRGGDWAFEVFWAVPIVTVFFAYIYSVCALLGLLTKSTLASLLLTLLFWFLLWLLNTADAGLLAFKTSQAIEVREYEQEIQQLEERIAAFDVANGLAEPVLDPDADAAAPALPSEGVGGFIGALVEALQNPDGEEQIQARREGLVEERDALKNRRDGTESTISNLEMWHGLVVGVKTVLPKTSETTSLLERYTISDEDRALRTTQANGKGQDPDQEVGREIEETFRSRSAGWVVGTSLGFTAVMFGFGAWRFSRRDF